MTGSQRTKADLVKLKVESSYNGKSFVIDNVVGNKPWKDDCNSLPDKLSLEPYEHFIDIDLKLLNNCECIDLLIGSDNACLMTALEKREEPLRSDLHALLTPFGWCAYGGASPSGMSALLPTSLLDYFYFTYISPALLPTSLLDTFHLHHC